jgi:chromosome segregation ATPase
VVIASEEVGDDDETILMSNDAPVAVARPTTTADGKATGSVRLPDSIPHHGGMAGDIGYLFRVIGRKRADRRELAAIELRMATEKEQRNQKLIELARQAVGDERVDQTVVGRARQRLLDIEEKRSQHAGKIAAAEEKIDILERRRKEESEDIHNQLEHLQQEIKAIDTSLEPLQKRHQRARKEAAKLRRQLEAIDAQMRKLESSVVAVDGPADKAAVQAEIASLKAEREALASEEPEIAAEIDELEPKIASLESSKSELEAKTCELRKDDEAGAVRMQEKIAAIEASKAVEDRAVKEQSSRRQNALLDLGEAIHHDRPDGDDPRIKEVEKHDLVIGTMERRTLELGELMGTVDNSAMVRGALYCVLIAAGLSAIALFVLLR